MLIKSYLNIIIFFFVILLSQFMSSKSISFEGNQKIENFYEAKKKLREANTIVVNSKKFLTIKTKKVQAFKEGRGKGSLLLKYRRGVNPFRRKKG